MNEAELSTLASHSSSAATGARSGRDAPARQHAGSAHRLENNVRWRIVVDQAYRRIVTGLNEEAVKGQCARRTRQHAGGQPRTARCALPSSWPPRGVRFKRI